ncbi:hypothetical protein NFI96_018627 [Prochilodus magdalenae]|nr:hypothetical protein NFI96_018627 [Prochilodus magdalenae]
MWFHLTAEGKRDLAYHTDANLVSPTYRDRIRYMGGHKRCSLQISNVKLSDDGQYHFRFETDHQQGRWTSPDSIALSVTGKVDLTSNKFPLLSREMSCEIAVPNLCAEVGLALRVVHMCRFSVGSRAPAAGKNFALYRNGVNLGYVDKVSTIYNFNNQHAGTYYCRPIPPQNVQSPGITLAVGYAPHHTTVLVNPMGAMVEGSSVTLTCSSEGAPAVESFAWFKEGESGSVPDSFKPELRLWSLDYRDYGEYFCVARNSLGTDRSQPILVNVTYPPKDTKVLISPRGDIMEGYSINLTCITNANPPVMKYAWYKVGGGQPWAKGSSQNLTFSSVRSHHGGQFYCTAWNMFGVGTSSTVTLSVLYAPKNTSVLARPSSVIEAGASLTLTCSSQANPAVENYTWHRINAADAWEIQSGSSYTIAEVSSGASGQYFCQARNRIGIHSSPVLTVRVRGRLKVIALVSAVGVSIGLITLTVAVMISKNMHRVDTEVLEEDKQLGSPMEVDTLFYECPQQTFQLRKMKMADIPRPQTFKSQQSKAMGSSTWLPNTLNIKIVDAHKAREGYKSAKGFQEEPEDVYETAHPAIVPLKEATESTEGDGNNGKVKYVTVHYSRVPSLDQAHITKVPLDGTKDPKEGPSVVYSLLAKQP